MEIYCEPDHDDSVKCCPDCEHPNQFGELCAECERQRELALHVEKPARARKIRTNAKEVAA